MTTLQDLIKLGFLQAGDRLYWKQPRLGIVHFASVQKDGRITTTDGCSHRTPSGAARHYYQKPIDGWYSWRVERTDERLTDIRNKVEKQETGQDTT